MARGDSDTITGVIMANLSDKQVGEFLRHELRLLVGHQKYELEFAFLVIFFDPSLAKLHSGVANTKFPWS